MQNFDFNEALKAIQLGKPITFEIMNRPGIVGDLKL